MRTKPVEHTKETIAALLQYVSSMMDAGISEIHTSELIPHSMKTQFPEIDHALLPTGIIYERRSGWFRKSV